MFLQVSESTTEMESSLIASSMHIRLQEEELFSLINIILECMIEVLENLICNSMLNLMLDELIC